MTIAVPGALAALLTFLAFVAPALLGPAPVLALAASACRLATLMLLRRAPHWPGAADDAAVQRGSGSCSWARRCSPPRRSNPDFSPQS